MSMLHMIKKLLEFIILLEMRVILINWKQYKISYFNVSNRCKGFMDSEPDIMSMIYTQYWKQPIKKRHLYTQVDSFPLWMLHHLIRQCISILRPVDPSLPFHFSAVICR